MILKAVVRDATLTERAQESLQELIINSRMGAGDRLPSEAEMARMLGVSRTVVREAVRLLVARGLVEVRTGSGIFVKQLDANVVRDPMELLVRSRSIEFDEIIEAREAIEMKVAELAGARRTAEDLRGLEEIVSALKNPKLTPLDYARTDVEFHLRIARASHNSLLLTLAEALTSLMVEPLRQCAEEMGVKKASENAYVDHVRVLEAIRKGEAPQIREAMRQELRGARRHWPSKAASAGERVSGSGTRKPER
jgi:GntR family transcriptional repressor for pyruvate dehydrogenase complex